MTAMEELVALRKRADGVETAAFVDHASGTVLCASAAIDPPQERLDAFCAQAAELLGSAGGKAEMALRLTSLETLLIFRAPASPDEALCLVAAPGADVAALEAEGRATAAALAR